MPKSNRSILIVLAVAVISAQRVGAQGVIATYAGANRLFTGDGQPATSVYLSKISSISLDSSNRPIIAAQFRNVVLRVNPDGSLTRLAGTGETGTFGNGQLATSAGLSAPKSAVYDSLGNLYIADYGNNRIQRVAAANGTVTTFAGSATGKAGGVQDNIQATQALLNSPTVVAVDKLDNLYINDEGNRVIRKVSQGVITTVAGDGGQSDFQPNQPGPKISLKGPEGIALDSAGNLYIADASGNRIIRVDAATHVASSIAGTGIAGTPQENAVANTSLLNNPGGVAVDSAGGIYVSDTNSFKIRKIVNGLISTIAGSGRVEFSGDGGPAKSAGFNAVFGLALDSQSNLYLADRDNFCVRRVDGSSQIVKTIAGNGVSFDNGVPGSDLLLFRPTGVTLGPDGGLYIADANSDVVRSVSPSGRAVTVAGTGGHGYGGDQDKATSAELATPFGSAFDSRGNLYIADTDNDVIRKVDTAGIITTVVGGGTDVAGNQVPPTAVRLSTPTSVAIDASDNLYIADRGNDRVRLVSNNVVTTIAGTGTKLPLSNPYGVAYDATRKSLIIADSLTNSLVRSLSLATNTMTTIAGGGNVPYPASNNGAATAAQLGAVFFVATDAQGFIYLSDQTNHVVEKFLPGGNLVAIAGNGKAGFSGDGFSATAASLNFPAQIAVDSAGNIFIADTLNDRIRVVYSAPPGFQASPSQLSFSSASGDLPISQPLALTTKVGGLAYSISSSASWLSVTLSSPFGQTPAVSGQMPVTLTVTADPSQLAPGAYDADIVITSVLALPSTQSIKAHFNVTAARPSQLDPKTRQLRYSFAPGSTATTQSLLIGNSGGGNLAFAVKTATDDGGNWLRVSSPSGSAPVGKPFALTVTADPTSLPPGTYKGAITLSNSATASDVAPIVVGMTISGVAQTMTLSQTGFTFTAVAGGGFPPAQTFEVVNNGTGRMDWTASASTADPGLTWLSVTPGSGSSTGGQTPDPVSVQVNPAGLAAATYYGQIVVKSATARNAPQFITVVLDLRDPGQSPGPLVQPTGLLFTAIAGGSNPPPQTITVYDLGVTPLTLGSGRAFAESPQFWFVHDPINATVTPNSPVTFTVTPQIAGLPPKVYHGALTLSFGDGSTRTIAIVLIVAAPGAGEPAIPTASGLQPRSTSTAACAPQTLVPVFTTLAQDFSLPTSWPESVVVRVADDCGNPLTAGSVGVTFSNGDSPLTLTSLQDGRWKTTWTPVHTTSGNTVITATARAGALAGSSTQSGGFQNNASPPVISPEGVLSVTNGSPGAPLAPGEFISIYGANLSTVSSIAPGLPYETTLQGVKAVLLGVNLPLHLVSPSQINAIIPYDLPTNQELPLYVQFANKYSGIVKLQLADTLPTIFTVPSTGTGQGAITDINGNVLDAAHAVSAGSPAVIYCTGLGAVDSSVPAGSASPGNPVANARADVSVTIGGLPVQQVIFKGLTPTAAGLYQINVVIPEGVSPGSSVPVVVTVGGRSSNAVTIAVK